MTQYSLPEWAIDLRGKLFPDVPPLPNGNGQDAKPFTFFPLAQPPAMAKWDDAEDFMGSYEPANPVIGDILGNMGLYTLTAKTGTGKTTILVNMAIAVALGIQDGDLLGMEVEQGRVAFLTCENPDGLKLRLRTACRRFGVEQGALQGKLFVQSSFDTAENMLAAAQHHAKSGEFKLLIIDTLQAFFPGDNSNESGQVMQFLRALRPLTFIPGSPAVLIAAHPKKDADPTDKETLIPYGSGAILNEVDGNLCLSKPGKPGKPTEDVQARESEVVVLHWAGKLRLVDFEPKYFRLDLLTDPETRDAKGQMIKMPVALVAQKPSPQEVRTFNVEVKFKVLGALYEGTCMTQAALATQCCCGASAISKCINNTKDGLKPGKLVERDSPTEGWRITKKGRERYAEYLNEVDTLPGGKQSAMRL